MNTLVEYEAGVLVDLLAQGDELQVQLFMDRMNIPFDIQGQLLSEMASLNRPDSNKIAQVIESHGHSSLGDRLGY
ncbi:hypothetical protein [Shewanella waksmanii]|uniref:hypothetical protein n=1 Tax=Shewanella waksmanii TaxID=213783 RepID=UPI0037367003